MPFNRTNFCLAVGFLLMLAAAPALAQGPQGMQIFGLADVSTYGGDQPKNEGYFFKFDGLWWSITPPKVHQIGFPDTREVYYGPHPLFPGDYSDERTQSNTLDTSMFNNENRIGNRIEFGRVEDRNGWFVSIFQLRRQDQFFTAPAADMVFNDPVGGESGEPLLYGNVNGDSSSTPPYDPPIFKNLPVTFYNLLLENSIKTWGVEANYLHRFRTMHAGGTFEMFLGARYFELVDTFAVTTGADPGGHTVPSFLAGSSWSSVAENHVVGPQLGLRWFKKQGRWTFSTEGRFLAGVNIQNIRQTVDMGPNLDPGPIATEDGTYYRPFQPKVMAHTTATHVAYEREWCPAVELRLEASYQITRSISFSAGWTGMWMDNLARASSVIDYTVPAFGVNVADNREDIFMNGLTVGFNVNR
jgi:hypothetical protein